MQIKFFLMTGNNSKKEHKQIREQLQKADPRETLILIATGSLIGEGFDFPRLDTLLMATPVPSGVWWSSMPDG